jgi:hypothetical protein
LIYLSIAAGVLVFLFKYPPLADYTEWVYQSYILSDLLHGGANSQLFYVRHYPVPYVITQVMMAGLNPALGPIWAGKVTLVVYLALAAWLSKKFVERYELNGVLAYPLLLCCIIFNSSFWSGYINYQFGLLVLMAYLSLNENWQNKMWINAAFALLAFSSHGFCLLTFGVIAGLRACTQGWRSTLTFALACLPTFLLTLWYMAVHNNDAMQNLEAAAPYLSMKFWAYKMYTLTKAGPYQNFMLGTTTDIDRSNIYYYLGALENIGIGLALIALHIRVFHRFLNPKTFHLSLAVSVLGLIYIIAPSLAMQVVNPGERILYPELLCVFAIALSDPKDAPIKSWNKYFAISIYLFLTATITNLALATLQQGYESVMVEEFAAAQKNYTRILYWHRPYQFQHRHEYMEQSYKNGTPINVPITFPTSLVANKPPKK